jgi:hypothetical protein
VVTYFLNWHRADSVDATHWYGAGFACLKGYCTTTGALVYWDDVSLYDYSPVSIRSLPAWSPGNSVEFQGSGISVDGSAANLYDGDLTTNYQSTATFEAWAGLDLGSGNTGTLTRVLVGADYEALGTTNELEYLASWMVVEGASTGTSGPWTQLGTLCWEARNRGNYIPIPITPGSSYRYFRVINHDLPCYLAELRFEGQIGSGTPSWQPVRPTFSPAAGKCTNGSTVTITTPTSGASLYYTTDGSTPTTGSTLYTGPVTLPSNAVTTVKAIAYHASGTTTSSAVTTGVFTCPLEYISDTGITRYGTGYNWPEDLYDDAGVLGQFYYGTLYQEAGKLWLFGEYHNTPNNGTSVPRGIHFWIYSSTDFYNWHYEGTTFCPPTNNSFRDVNNVCAGGMNRLHVWKNPSPINAANTYLGVANIISGGYVIMTAQHLPGPWVFQSFGTTVNGVSAGDNCLLYDTPSGNLYWCFRDTGFTHQYACQLNSATDYTTFTGSNLTLDSTANREGICLFLYSGCYYMLTSYLVNFGQTNARMQYKAVEAANFSAAATALNAAGWTNLWASGAPSPSVAYNAQSCSVIPIAGRQGMLMTFDICDPNESPVNVPHMRHIFWPLPYSAISAGASPSINVTPPVTWTIAGSLPTIGGNARWASWLSGGVPEYSGGAYS